MFMRRRIVGVVVLCLAALAVVFAARRSAEAQVCPPGFAYSYALRRCVPLSTCPPGYVRNGYGQCVSGGPPRLCPPGLYYFRGRCFPR
jgi:hypothetical protein